MKPGPSNDKDFELLIAEQQKHIGALEHNLAEAGKNAQKYKDEWSSLYDQHKELRDTHHRLQHDYEILRLQKGGFGFKMLILSGFAGFLLAVVPCFAYLKLKPKDSHLIAFREFQRENLFNYELAISRGQFEDVEKSLKLNMERPEYQLIVPEIEFSKNLVEAAHRHCRQ
ncbi:MAG: hypothetical protein KA165_07645 [Saprospiraceae bacterium]|nr:hypothetical protein [Saprospiraceae bacterium]